MPKPLRRGRPLRLHLSTYADVSRTALITVVTKMRRRVFATADLAGAAVDVIRERAAHHGVRVFAYCVMPDHLHLVVAPSETCDLIRYIGETKNLAQARAWKLGTVGLIWQTSFHDWMIRDDAQFHRSVRYVIENPVKARLVKRWREFPFSGSLVLEPELLREILR